MKTRLTLLILGFVSQAFGQAQVKIDRNADSIRKTKVCTDFQYFHCLENGTAKFNSDTLKINFLNVTAATFDDLNLVITEDKAHITYKTVYKEIVNGRNEWLPLKNSITLSTNKFVVGKKVKGFLETEFQETFIDHNGNKQERRIIKFSGEFAVKIE